MSALTLRFVQPDVERFIKVGRRQKNGLSQCRARHELAQAGTVGGKDAIRDVGCRTPKSLTPCEQLIKRQQRSSQDEKTRRTEFPRSFGSFMTRYPDYEILQKLVGRKGALLNHVQKETYHVKPVLSEN